MNRTKRHVVQMLRHDTSFARLIVALGLVLLGITMFVGLGSGEPGYVPLEKLMHLPFWGALFLFVGAAGVHGSLEPSLPKWYRAVLCFAGMILWTMLTVAQFSDEMLPTRMLLFLPAAVEVFVLIKLAVFGEKVTL